MGQVENVDRKERNIELIEATGNPLTASGVGNKTEMFENPMR